MSRILILSFLIIGLSSTTNIFQRKRRHALLEIRTMKLVTLIPLILSFHFAVGQSNTDRLASYKNNGQHLQTSIRGWHDFNYKGQLDGVKKISYSFLVLFQIDTTGHIINIRFNKEDDVPDVVRNYALTLLKTTDGDWKPQVHNCRQLLSDTITCKFFFAKKQAPEELLNNKDQKAGNERMLDYTNANAPKISLKTLDFNSQLDNHCWVVIGY